MSQDHSAHHHSDDPTHLEEFCHDVAENAENVGESHLGYFILRQKSAFLEDPRTQQSSNDPYENWSQYSSYETTNNLLQNVSSSHIIIDLIK